MQHPLLQQRNYMLILYYVARIKQMSFSRELGKWCKHGRQHYTWYML